MPPRRFGLKLSDLPPAAQASQPPAPPSDSVVSSSATVPPPAFCGLCMCPLGTGFCHCDDPASQRLPLVPGAFPPPVPVPADWVDTMNNMGRRRPGEGDRFSRMMRRAAQGTASPTAASSVSTVAPARPRRQFGLSLPPDVFAAASTSGPVVTPAPGSPPPVGAFFNPPSELPEVEEPFSLPPDVDPTEVPVAPDPLNECWRLLLPHITSGFARGAKTIQEMAQFTLQPNAPPPTRPQLARLIWVKSPDTPGGHMLHVLAWSAPAPAPPDDVMIAEAEASAGLPMEPGYLSYNNLWYIARATGDSTRSPKEHRRARASRYIPPLVVYPPHQIQALQQLFPQPWPVPPNSALSADSPDWVLSANRDAMAYPPPPAPLVIPRPARAPLPPLTLGGIARRRLGLDQGRPDPPVLVPSLIDAPPAIERRSSRPNAYERAKLAAFQAGVRFSRSAASVPAVAADPALPPPECSDPPDASAALALAFVTLVLCLRPPSPVLQSVAVQTPAVSSSLSSPPAFSPRALQSVAVQATPVSLSPSVALRAPIPPPSASGVSGFVRRAASLVPRAVDPRPRDRQPPPVSRGWSLSRPSPVLAPIVAARSLGFFEWRSRLPPPGPPPIGRSLKRLLFVLSRARR